MPSELYLCKVLINFCDIDANFGHFQIMLCSKYQGMTKFFSDMATSTPFGRGITLVLAPAISSKWTLFQNFGNVMECEDFYDNHP